jgi:uncharacterized protein YjdB
MRHIKKLDWAISLSLLLACVLTVIAGCVEASGPLGAPDVIEGGVVAGKVSSVQITLARSALAPGQTTQATAVAKSADGEVIPGPVGFSSKDPAIATVSSDGVVTALKVGVVLIQASVACCSATASLTVNSVGSPVAVVVVALDSTSLAIGHSAKATATAKDSVGNIITGETVTWASLSPNVATVSTSGTVTAVAAGSATIQGMVSGRTGSASLMVQVADPVPATVSVAIDSMTLLVGHVAHGVVTATDALGNTIANPTVTWTSLAPGVATVSSSGAITAVAEGSVVIRATVSGVAGTDSLLVVVPPNLASQNFDGGSYSPYYNFWDPAVGGDGTVDIVSDPTGSGRGKVARMHYVHTNGDSNRFLQYSHVIGFDSTMFSRGDFYLDVADLGTGLWGRKLIYYRPNQPVSKFGGAWREFAVVVDLQGNDLRVSSWYVRADGTTQERSDYLPTHLLPRTWYTLETQVTPETSIGAGDGIVRVWLNGSLVYEITNLQLTDPAWIGIPVPGGNSTPYELSDAYLAHVDVGEQVNLNTGSFDEYRYWDKVAFSTKRIGQ